MNAAPIHRPFMDKRALVKQAMLASIKTRSRAGVDLINPICIFDLCDKLGLTVRFTDINMEGMYDRSSNPRIHLSSLRPLVRRVFTCGHELGHHEFGHGSTIDEMQEEAAALQTESPDEFLVNAFSAFTLMPTVGLRGAFAKRQQAMATTDDITMFAVASNFGVGYTTLVSHLAYGIEQITRERARQLLKSTPKSIKKQLLGDAPADPLVLVDQFWTARAIDVEVNTLLLLPTGAKIDGKVLKAQNALPTGDLYKAVRPGIGRVELTPGNFHFVRVASEKYVGLARYRRMEDDDV